MLLDGKALADTILTNLTGQVKELASRNIIPTLAVILVGDDPASLAYIRQKQKAADRIGAKLLFDHQNASLTGGGLYNLITRYNSDPAVHGLIVQRPIPKEMGKVNDVLAKVRRTKDVDGFLTDSPFDVPVAMAVGELLRNIHSDELRTSRTVSKDAAFISWLQGKRIVVIGRGETAGAPIARYFQKLDCTTSIIHSRTPAPEPIIKNADIIISCVGKERVVTGDAIKNGCRLISVGIWRDAAGKLRGDYDEQDVGNIAGWYTPTPGGVGPVNVACLMKNLIKACTIEKGGNL